MSGSSTASSSSPDTSLWGDGSGGRMQDDGLETRSQATFINIPETPGYEQSREQSTAAEQHREAPANFARTDRLPGTMSGTGQAPVNPRPMSSHPSRDRKRRLTSTGEHARLQRSRSGGGHGRSVPRSEGLLPHRSVSMILPSSKSASSAAPGSSYDMAIDITSSPPGPASSASHADYPESLRIVPGESRPSAGLRAGYTSPGSSKSAAGSARYPIQEAPSSFPRAYSWSEYASMDGGDEYHGHFAGNADLGSRRPGLTVHGREHAFQRGSVGSYEGFQSARGLAHRQSEDTHPSRSPRREQSTQIVPESGVFLGEDASPSTAVYHSDRRYAARGQWGVAPEVVRRGSAYGSRPSSSCYTSRSVSSRNDYLDGQEELDGMTLPRWQPDAEVSECPICGTVFSFWYRKHHCRKCGRVVCAACSPHRITIPRQFIVRPPPSTALPSSSPVPPPRPIIDLTGEDSLSSSSIINPALGGGEEVRLCNPCVPDPNPNPPGYASLRSHGHRPTHSLSSTMGNTFSPELHGSRSGRQERRTLATNDRPSFLRELGHQVRQNMHDTIPRVITQEREIRRARRASAQAGATSTGATTTRVAPPQQPPRPPAVSERDLCPVCGRRFPPISDEQPLEAREAHIRHCIEDFGAASAQQEASAQQGPATPRLPSAVARMVEFKATEKDCLGEDGQIAECTICMEDYEVGQQLARLLCFCKFHKTCIVNWFERKKECPVHKAS